MTDDNNPASDMAAETVSEFLASFSYGSRTDLNFKFLKSLNDEAGKEFIARLLDAVGTAYDTGDLDDVIQTAISAQIEGYAPDPTAPSKAVIHDDGPFQPPTRPLNESRIGLITTSGHFVKGDDPMPFGETQMTQSEAIKRIGEFLRSEPTLSEIPSDTSSEDLRVRHGGYDITSAAIDPNVCFPIDVLASMADDDTVGSLAATYFSFPGATAQGLLRRVVPSWIDRLEAERIDVLLLVPV